MTYIHRFFKLVDLINDIDKPRLDWASLVTQTVKTCDAEDPGSIPGLRRSPGEGNGNPLQYSCLENPVDRGAWRATVHEIAISWTRLSD